MMQQFRIEMLKAHEYREAWAILRSSGAYANLEWWLSEAEELVSAGGGVLGARAKDSRLHGIATFEPSGRPTERVLTVHRLITFELSRSEPARRALLKELERIGTRLDCTHIAMPLSGKCAAWPVSEAPHHAASS